MLVDFSLELAMLAYQENVLKLGSLLMEFLTSRGAQAASSVVVCIAHKALLEPSASRQLSVDAVCIILRCLINWVRRSHANQGKEFVEDFQDVYKVFGRLDPRISALAQSSDTGNAKVARGSEIPTVAPSNQSDAALTVAVILLPTTPGSSGALTAFLPYIEKETEVLFQKLYQGELLPDQAVDILRRMKASNVRKRYAGIQLFAA
ncbi:hypothetical protein BWQ96_10652 [Gracilariopsis chorda]|nr:hypothetical protein BWQ96_10652 [Gracilariopsis chorda]|eukprot:PXF39647.1 hypothetical protein BWQ96_10652 [Gracilariopsis chorda]